ncbi:hypothetical protein [Novosphingobium aquae]|uniref:Acyl-protein synthetase LuxE domain-containing protein n=1 Tax=Novosphingobium aquae TaxID=3133435 RepID=A0ABU8S603_9SPHN
MQTAMNGAADRVGLLLTEPLALAGYDHRQWNRLARDELDALQLDGLKRRFAQFREIPMLKKLAEGEGINRLESIEDVVPLLFEHTVYKSYPPSLLDRNDYVRINKWLTKLVVPELAEAITNADVSHCRGLDDWFEAMDRAVPQLRFSHTSGTSGTISFLPNSCSEFLRACMVRRLFVWGMQGPDTPQPELHFVYPYFRRGFLSHLRANEFMVAALLPNEDHFHPAYPGTLSSDVQRLGAQIRAAHVRGTLDRLEISPEVMAKKRDFDAMQAEMPAHLSRFFERKVEELRGKRVYIGATWNLLHNMAQAGLSRGMEGVFHPDSYVTTTGGAKGVVQPEGWREDLLRFTGAKRINETYAMSEVVSGSHMRCDEGHYHFAPTVIPYVLDPETGRALARKGRVTGRAAFYDLGSDIRWGGFITGDEISVEWDEPCACGQPSRYVVGPIERYSEKQGGDDKITCAASEASHREAMDFLGTVEG